MPRSPIPQRRVHSKPVSMNVKRITRLLRLLQILQSGNGQNADGFAKACGVSRRTMFQDIEALSLVALANELGRCDRLSFYEPAHAAARKLEGSLPPALRQKLQNVTRAIRIQPLPVSPLEATEAFYQQLVDNQAEVLQPVRLRRLVAQRAKNMAQMYDGAAK
jgi:hypothetical protein